MKDKTFSDISHGKQSNHQSFYIPKNIQHLGKIPLYQAVIWWGLHLEKEFSRDEVSRAFRIDLRRASAILNYICHRLDIPGTVIEFCNKAVNGTRSRLYVTVISVSFKKGQALNKNKNLIRKKNTLATKQQERQLANWLLSRPLHADKECFEKWKASCPVKQD